MDENTQLDTEIQPRLGEQLRVLRQERALSLAEVANATGISMSFLSHFETGKSDITVSRLVKLLRFYGIGLADLLPDIPKSDPIIVRKGEERHVRSSEGIDLFLLVPNTRRTMMPYVTVFEPGGRNVEAVSHEGEEFIYVLEGNVAVDLEGSEPCVLGEGDAAYFRAERPHVYRNRGETRARVLGVVSPPSL